MEDTDNFAFIIGEMRRKQEEIEHLKESWRKWDEARRRELPWCWAIGLAMVVFLVAIAYL